MPQLLRGNLRQTRWFVNPDIPWLAPGDLQGDSLVDLITEDNALSVYEVRNNVEEERVSVALAATRDRPAKYDYAVFEEERFQIEA